MVKQFVKFFFKNSLFRFDGSSKLGASKVLGKWSSSEWRGNHKYFVYIIHIKEENFLTSFFFKCLSWKLLVEKTQ